MNVKAAAGPGARLPPRGPSQASTSSCRGALLLRDPSRGPRRLTLQVGGRTGRPGTEPDR